MNEVCDVCKREIEGWGAHSPHDRDCPNYGWLAAGFDGNERPYVDCDCDNTTCGDCCWECEETFAEDHQFTEVEVTE